jgi:hypothetical protein
MAVITSYHDYQTTLENSRRHHETGLEKQRLEAAMYMKEVDASMKEDDVRMKELDNEQMKEVFEWEGRMKKLDNEQMKEDREWMERMLIRVVGVVACLVLVFAVAWALVQRL